MRIVAHNGARIWGGAERATVRLLRGLGERGHYVRLLCNDQLVARQAEKEGVPADICEIGGDVAVPHAVRFASALESHDPDVVIIGTWKKLFLAALGARIAGVTRIVARVGLETDTPRSAKYRIALRRWVDGVVVNSERMVAPFESLAGFGSHRVALIHNGVRRPHRRLAAGAVRESLGIPEDTFVVGVLARLVSQKRIDRLIDALGGTPDDVHCIIAGDGEEGEALQAKADTSGIASRVHFLGHREDTGDVLDAFDCFAVTSDREGLSNSMLEAMSCGLPVISTPVSGAADAVGGESPAGIITTFEPASIAQALVRLDRDAELRSNLGANAIRKAETTFSVGRMLDKWEEFLAHAGAARA